MRRSTASLARTCPCEGCTFALLDTDTLVPDCPGLARTASIFLMGMQRYGARPLPAPVRTWPLGPLPALSEPFLPRTGSTGIGLERDIREKEVGSLS